MAGTKASCAHVDLQYDCEVGARIRPARLATRMTQTQLANAADVAFLQFQNTRRAPIARRLLAFVMDQSATTPDATLLSKTAPVRRA
ncbi:transcriptional regulator with XRE-family HTH domain [Brevundimonas variabilis]|uniref:Transcriptional regulator with XRE-family HTH domain n=1 Tax=Brevundimonas variabilis TaxID=74312 RepID=A0A7W9CKF6_9CAUL|nr:transcriptional regulator with XRE-family HTH domain [Brevundimonas variabilis]